MTKLPIVLDDLIEEELQNQIEDSIFDCFYRYSADITLGSTFSENKYRKILSPFQHDVTPAFVANITPTLNKKTHDKTISLIEKGCNAINFNLKEIQRVCSGIHAIVRDKQKCDLIHVNGNQPHLVMLYYVNDCDGDTLLYDKTLEDIPFDNYYPDENYELNIKHRVTPKRGRVLFFEGKVYHTSSSPTNSTRCVITADLFGEFKDGSYKFPAPIKNKKNNLMYQ